MQVQINGKVQRCRDKRPAKKFFQNLENSRLELTDMSGQSGIRSGLSELSCCGRRPQHLSGTHAPSRRSGNHLWGRQRCHFIDQCLSTQTQIFTHNLLKGLTYVPHVILTDKPKSYAAAKRELLPGVEHRQHRYPNTRMENSHQPTHQRERRVQRFESLGHAQRFLSAHGPIAQHFRPRRHRAVASAYRQELRKCFQIWREVITLALAA